MNKLMKKILLISFVLGMTACLGFMLVGCFGGAPTTQPNKTPPKTEVVDLSDCTIRLSAMTVSYDGSEQHVTVTVSYDDEVVATIPAGGTHPQISVTYQNNVEPGTANITIAAKPDAVDFTGTKRVSFTIIYEAPTASGYERLIALLSDPSTTTVELTDDVTVPENDTLTIPSGMEVCINGNVLTVNGTLENNGRLNFNTANRSYLENSGTVINNGEFELGDYTRIDNVGSIVNNGSITADDVTAYIYTNSDIEGNQPVLNAWCELFRKYSIDEWNPVLSFTSSDYTGEALYPAVNLSREGMRTPAYGGDYSLAWENNVNAGTGIVTITAEENSTVIYGTKTFEFTINKVDTQVGTVDTLVTAMENPNYSKVTLDRMVSFDEEITVPEFANVEIKDLTVNAALTVNGTLTITGGDNLLVLDVFSPVSGSGELIVADAAAEVRARAEFSVESFVNHGVAFDFGGLILSGTDVKNYGEIYIDTQPTANVTNMGGVTEVRKSVDLDDVVVTDDEIEYDKTEHVASFTFLDGSVLRSEYTTEVYYVADPDTLLSSGNYPVTVGEAAIDVTFNHRSKSYIGSVTIPYSIVPGTTSVTGYIEYRNAMNDLNYGTIKVTADAIIGSGETLAEGRTIIIDEGVTAKMGDAGLTILGTFINNGTVVNDGTHGSTENPGYDNVFVAAQDGNDGEIINNGEMYLNGTRARTISGSGAVYERSDLTVATVGEYQTEYVFERNTMHFPKPTLTIGGEAVDAAEYTYSWTDNYFASLEENKSTVTVGAKLTSKVYYGGITETFTVKQAEITVATADEFLTAVKSLNAYELYKATCNNYSKITLSANIDVPRPETAEGDEVTTENLYVMESTTLDLNGYTLELPITRDDAFTKYNGYKLNLDGKYIVNADMAAIINVDQSATGSIVGYAASSNELMILTNYCNEVYVTGGLNQGTSDLDGTHLRPQNKYGCTIDLQGNSAGYIYFTLQYTNLTVKSTGSAASIAILELTSREGENFTVMDNLVIGTAKGFNIVYDEIADNVTITNGDPRKIA